MTKLEEMATKFKERYENNEKAKEFVAQLKEKSANKANTKAKAKTGTNSQSSFLETLRLNIEKINMMKAEEGKETEEKEENKSE